MHNRKSAILCDVLAQERLLRIDQHIEGMQDNIGRKRRISYIREEAEQIEKKTKRPSIMATDV